MSLKKRSLKRITALAAAAFLLAACFSSVCAEDLLIEEIPETEAAPAAYGDSGDYAPDRLLVAYDETLSFGTMEESAASCDGTVTDVVTGPGSVSQTDGDQIAVVTLSDGTTVEEAIETLESDPFVLYAQPDYYLYTAAVKTNDPYLENQYYLMGDGAQYYGNMVRGIGAFDAWDAVKEAGYETVRVAVIDTGANKGNADLRKAVDWDLSREVLEASDVSNAGTISYELGELKGDDYFLGEASSQTSNNHGSHVTGIIGATANNRLGIAGTASLGTNDMLDLFVVDAFGDENGRTETSYVLAALDYVESVGNVRVVNMSLGMTGEDDTPAMNRALEQKCARLRDLGVTIVCAAGNIDNTYGIDATTIQFPAAYESTISVISTAAGGTVSDTSCYGAWNDLCAPGEDILSCKGTGYESKTGTSMAAPQVAAVAAMMYAVRPELTPEDVRQILRDTATDIESPGFDERSCYGLVNAQAAVAAALELEIIPPEPEIPAESVAFNEENITIGGKNSVTLTPVFYPEGALSEPLIWESSDPSAAAVDGDGVVTGVFRGQTVVSARSEDGRLTASCRVTVEFGDVMPGHVRYPAVSWGAGKGITNGYKATNMFGVDDPCTRGHFVMFLWKLAGRPAARQLKKPYFTDVPASHTFFRAVQWAYEKGITKGVSKTVFGVNNPCTRGQAMTFLWRYKGRPKPKSGVYTFKDSPLPNATQRKAIMWGAENRITGGYKNADGTRSFRPGETCTRGHVMHFLYKMDLLK